MLTIEGLIAVLGLVLAAISLGISIARNDNSQE